ncbi:MAG: iron uptake porin, partial [Microcoleus sp.]
MNKIIWKLLLASPAIIGLSSAVAPSGAMAKEATVTNAEASQLAAPVTAESQILAAASVAAPVAAAPAAEETLAANSTSAIEQPSSEAAELQTKAIEAPEAVSIATPTEAKTDAAELAATALPAPAAETAPAATASAIEPVATAAPESPASDSALQSSQNPAPQTTELPAAAVPTNRVEVAQSVPSGMGGQIVPAAPQAQPTQQSGAMSQVTSVSQLSDVQPTDWAFQALQSLVERYGCIVGYPDGTYRGNRALTRYEFAAGVNACLDQVTKLIGASTANFVTKDDLA